MSQTKAYEKCLRKINRQLEKRRIMVKKFTLVDASIIETPLKPKGKSVYAMPKDISQSAQQAPLENKPKQQ